MTTGARAGSGAIWLFGYGSLIWKHDFPILNLRPGYLTGWERRFWQGSHDHRGLPHDPGRVVTLVEAPGRRCDGVALLVGPTVFEHLDHREKNGYQRVTVDIRFDDADVTDDTDATDVTGVTYYAPAANPAFLGPAPMAEMAAQINRCAGPSGSNRDYVLTLARALRRLSASDPHVFEVESWVLAEARGP